MRTFRVTLERHIYVDIEATRSSEAINIAQLRASNGEYNELWENARTGWSGISDVTLPTNEVKK